MHFLIMSHIWISTAYCGLYTELNNFVPNPPFFSSKSSREKNVKLLIRFNKKKPIYHTGHTTLAMAFSIWTPRTANASQRVITRQERTGGNSPSTSSPSIPGTPCPPPRPRPQSNRRPLGERDGNIVTARPPLNNTRKRKRDASTNEQPPARKTVQEIQHLRQRKEVETASQRQLRQRQDQKTPSCTRNSKSDSSRQYPSHSAYAYTKSSVATCTLRDLR